MREHKGQSLIDLPNTYTLIDLETTGLNPKKDSIIEVAAIRVIEGVAKSTFSEFASLDFPVPKLIVKKTGITDEMLAGAREKDFVLADFFDFVGDSLVMAHNAHFDINFLYESSMEIFGEPFSNDFICTLRIARKAYPSERYNKLSDIVEREGIVIKDSHRALADCETLKKVYDIMKERLLQEYDMDSYIDLFPRRHIYDDCSSLYDEDYHLCIVCKVKDMGSAGSDPFSVTSHNALIADLEDEQRKLSQGVVEIMIKTGLKCSRCGGV